MREKQCTEGRTDAEKEGRLSSNERSSTVGKRDRFEGGTEERE